MRHFLASAGLLLLVVSLSLLVAPLYLHSALPTFSGGWMAFDQRVFTGGWMTPNQPMVLTNPAGADAKGFYFAEVTQEENLPPVIVIDPGHGGIDEGAEGFDVKEKDIALDVALRLEQLLEQDGCFTVLTRRSDVYVPLADRAGIANEYDNSLFVSIHFNQSADLAATGVETYYADAKVLPDFYWYGMNALLSPFHADDSKSLASTIQDAVVGALAVTNRGVKARDLFVLCNARGPAVLVEGGFVSNPLDAWQLKDPNYREQLAVSIANGIMYYQRKGRPRSQQIDFTRVKD